MMVWVSITARRLATKTGNRLVVFRRICKTAVESVQKTDLMSGIPISFFTSCSSRTDTTAAVSSSLGTDTDFMRATRAFPIMNTQ